MTQERQKSVWVLTMLSSASHHSRSLTYLFSLYGWGGGCFTLQMHIAMTEAAWSLCAVGGSSKHSAGHGGDFLGEFRQTLPLIDS